MLSYYYVVQFCYIKFEPKFNKYKKKYVKSILGFACGLVELEI